jgi:hypothetical protein
MLALASALCWGALAAPVTGPDSDLSVAGLQAASVPSAWGLLVSGRIDAPFITAVEGLELGLQMPAGLGEDTGGRPFVLDNLLRVPEPATPASGVRGHAPGGWFEGGVLGVVDDEQQRFVLSEARQWALALHEHVGDGAVRGAGVGDGGGGGGDRVRERAGPAHRLFGQELLDVMRDNRGLIIGFCVVSLGLVVGFELMRNRLRRSGNERREKPERRVQGERRSGPDRDAAPNRRGDAPRRSDAERRSPQPVAR